MRSGIVESCRHNVIRIAERLCLHGKAFELMPLVWHRTEIRDAPFNHREMRLTITQRSGLRRIVHATDSIREQAENDPASTIAGLRVQLSDLERDAARYESEHRPRISRIEDIPDPFSCPSDEIGWVVQGLNSCERHHDHRRRGRSREDMAGSGANPCFDDRR
jgi:hypothetical protein